MAYRNRATTSTKTTTEEFDFVLNGQDVLVRFDRVTEWAHHHEVTGWEWSITDDTATHIEVEPADEPTTTLLQHFGTDTQKILTDAVEQYMDKHAPNTEDDGSDEPDWDAINDGRRDDGDDW